MTSLANSAVYFGLFGSHSSSEKKAYCTHLSKGGPAAAELGNLAEDLMTGKEQEGV